MAYKAKSYRKFIATAATATLVAGAVAPLASAATADQFKDVAPQYKEAVQFLLDKNATQGMTETKFGISENIKRVDAAVWVARVLDLDIDNAPDAGFKDVPARAQKEVNALKAAGITNGKSATEFGSNDLMTRGQLAKWIVAGFKLTGTSDKEFSDVKGTSYEEAVSILVANGITQGINETQFGTNQNTKRGDFAIFLQRADVAKTPVAAVTNVKAENGKVTVTLDKEVEAVKAEDFKLTQSIDGKEATAVVPTAVKLAEDKKTVELTVPVVAEAEKEQSIVVSVAYKTGTAKAAEAFKVVASTPAVTGVTAINASQFEVKFNKEVDKTTATAVANYKVAGNTVTKAEVQEDGKTVVLTVQNPYIGSKTTSITVENVKIKDSKDTFSLFAGVVAIHDTLAAQIAKVEGNTNGDVLKSVTIDYSEPVKAGAVIKIDGTKVAVTTAGVSQTIAGLSIDATKEHTVEIVNLADTADNVTPVATFKFTANKDVTLPEVKTVTALNDNQFAIEFNKKVEASTVEASDFKIVKSSDLSQVLVTTVEAEHGDTTGTKFVVTTNLTKSAYDKVSSIALTIAIQDKAFKDTLGNESVAVTKSVTLTKDTVAPVLETVSFEKDKDGQVTKVTLAYDEEVVLNGNVSNIEVVQDNGVLVSGLFTNATANGKTVELTVKTGVKSGVFSLSLPKGFVVDKALSANQSAAASKIVDFGKAESATTFEITSAVAASNVITVTFPGKVVGGAFEGSATSVDRYSLNGKPLPEGTKITLNADQTVATITLPAESIEKTDDEAVFQVVGVKLLTGEVNKLYTETLEVEDNMSPILTSAQVLADGKTLIFNYNEALGTVGANLGQEFKIVVDGKELTLEDTDLVKSTVKDKQIVATLTTAIADEAKEITVETVGTTSATVLNIDITDATNKNTQKDGIKVTATR